MIRIEGGKDDCLVCQLWLSLGRLKSRPWVVEDVNPVVFPLPTTTYAKLVLSEKNPDTHPVGLL